MPEGHTVHRIALQLAADFVGRHVAVSSPQGRFADGAALLDGAVMTDAEALGKHLFLGFRHDGVAPVGLPGAARGGAGGADGADGADGHPHDGGPDARWLRVHLGLYGAWDFRGHVSPIGIAREGVQSLGAPRVRAGTQADARPAVRMGEGERTLPPADAFPPPPVGQVRVRLLTDRTLADLRGPTACEVLTPAEVAVVVAQAGPDPRVHPAPEAEAEFVRRLTRSGTPIGKLLMDQSVVSGIGNLYRAELLFRAGIDPHAPGKRVPAETARALWEDWVHLLEDGVARGFMLTRADLDDQGRERAVVDPGLRHAVYGRAGEPCRACGTPVTLEDMAGRKLYWCPTCQR